MSNTKWLTALSAQKAISCLAKSKSLLEDINFR